VPVVHPCNPSYSRGRDQKDRSLKPAWANSLQDPISKNTQHKKGAGGVAQGVGPGFKPQHHQNQETNMANCSLGVVIRCIDVFQYYYTYFNLKRNNSTYEYNKKKIKRNNICNAGRTQYDIEKHPR
jgi:hypothetical protein